MTLDTGALENGLKRVEQFDTIPKTFERKYRIRAGKKTDIVRDSTGIFRTNLSITGGTDVTLDDKNNLPILETVITNNNNKFLGVLTFGNTWTFNYPTDITALSASSEDSDIFVQDGNSYSTFTVKSFNLPTNWTDDIELYIVDDSLTEHLIGWNDTITITSTSSAFFRMKNTSGGNLVFDMHNATGAVPLFEVDYE